MMLLSRDPELVRIERGTWLKAPPSPCGNEMWDDEGLRVGRIDPGLLDAGEAKGSSTVDAVLGRVAEPVEGCGT